MKKSLIICFFFFSLNIFAQTKFDSLPIYNGNDLGLTYTKEKSVFKIYAPTAEAVHISISTAVSTPDDFAVSEMKKEKNGIWKAEVKVDLKNKYYSFAIRQNGKQSNQVPDPYAKAVDVNGNRACIIDLKETNPTGWSEDKKPPLKNFTNIILYELHVRDFSIQPQSGIKHQGKFLAFTDTAIVINPVTQQKIYQGLQAIKDLGVTHIHLLPSFDFASVNELRLDSAQYNWGYDPKNYNVPEGSYSTNPNNPVTRIKEFKQAVQAIHKNGLRVVMDVVYNHTFELQNSLFNQLVPGYYYRYNKDGTPSNASGCGNEIATERPMVRKMIVESVVYWAKEYHMDGFRFDLMGAMDIETMKQVRAALDKIDSTIFIYGEGWTAGGSALADSLRLTKQNIKQVSRIAAFCDDMRDGIKGPWNDNNKTAFIGGVSGLEESIKFGIAGAVFHPQIDYSKVNYSKTNWANEPAQCINYVSCHDDNTLWDKIFISNPNVTEADRIKMDLLAQTIVLTSQGVPFIHAGEEFLRTKNLVSNSYKSADSINQLDWNRRAQYMDVVRYYQKLIQLRKEHPAFRMPNTEMLQHHLEFLPVDSACVIAYLLKGNANGDKWKDILVILNGNKTAQRVNIPAGNWRFATLNGELLEAGSESPPTPKPISRTTVPAISAVILFRE